MSVSALNFSIYLTIVLAASGRLIIFRLCFYHSARLPVYAHSSFYYHHAGDAKWSRVHRFCRRRRRRGTRSLPRADQILIHQYYNAYKDKFGFIYCNIRLINDIDGPRVVVKAGRTDNLERRMDQYAECGPGQILWISCYPTERAKAAERMVHLKFDLLGAKIMPFLCTCRTRHQEYVSFEAVGELEGAERVIEATMRSLGHEVIRSVNRGLSACDIPARPHTRLARDEEIVWPHVRVSKIHTVNVNVLGISGVWAEVISALNLYRPLTMVDFLEDDPDHVPILSNQIFCRSYFDTKTFCVQRYVCDAGMQWSSSTPKSPESSESRLCICGESYNPDDKDTTKEMHWCPFQTSYVYDLCDRTEGMSGYLQPFVESFDQPPAEVFPGVGSDVSVGFQY
ncbi:hypothetical protein B0H11DRAFT_1900168 [Mycena galericulata]|nr:hypothetical protein B0H11DRAFT_1900168 [Mycena galericulata]